MKHIKLPGKPKKSGDVLHVAKPEASAEAGLPKLLKLLADQRQPYMPPQPVDQAMPVAEPTPKTPAFMKFPFIKGRK